MNFFLTISRFVYYFRHGDDRLGHTMMSSLSADNLQLELSNCHSDGLSDKESVVRRMKSQVKHSPDRGIPVSILTICQTLQVLNIIC